MGTRKLGNVALWIMGVTALGGAAGCFLSKEDDSSTGDDAVTAGGDVSQVLKSTLVLKNGCIATKIGPKHLLIAARCVVGNDAFAAGKTLDYKSASTAAGSTVPATEKDGGTKEGGASDAGKAADASKEGGAGDAGSSSAAPTIASIEVHPSFTAKCTAGKCGLNQIDASDAPDIAVIVLEKELATVPTIPVDLDMVGEADPVMVVASGCSGLDKVGTKIVTTKTTAVPPTAVTHKGSPYAASPQLAARVGLSYVVTPGPAWQPNASGKVCLGDLGGPMFRQDVAAVTGLFSNYTARTATSKSPVTIMHTRIDQASRFKVGAWLDQLGAETTHSCSETADGCKKHKYSGGGPDDAVTGESDDDAGKKDAAARDASTGDDDASTGEDPASTGPSENPVSDDENADDGTGSEDPDYSDAAVPAKKKSSKGGCSAAPGSVPTDGIAIGLGLAVAAVVARRRRR
jgi:MYXO-CTERM domain-containing protein